MMTLPWAATLLLLAIIGLGATRMTGRSTRVDRAVSAQLVGTVALAVLLLLARATGASAFIDAALLLALAAVVTMLVVLRRTRRAGGHG